MQSAAFQIALVGSGPAGLSAACRAAELGISHVLLERADHLADTIFRYQKRKHVMATPDALPLGGTLPFDAGSREAVLASWEERAQRLGVNIRLRAEVVAIDGERGAFELRLAGGERVRAENVVLCIGVQGDPRRLGVPGAETERVQYQLDDPDAYAEESIVVVGAGDSAIENALALAAQNDVTLVNRRSEFARAKAGNLQAVLRAIERGELECLYDSRPTAIEPGKMTLETARGVTEIRCDRTIARLGALPPRAFLEAAGLSFPTADPSALPIVDERYETTRKGVYAVGALVGYPLIKQCINQGHEVVGHILGHEVEPADEAMLRARLAGTGATVRDTLDRLGRDVPLLRGVSRLQLRELLAESVVRAMPAGEAVCRRGEFGDTLFVVLSGSVELCVDPDDDRVRIGLGAGEFFGEIALISGRPRTATVLAGPGCLLLETPRRTFLRFRDFIPSVKAAIDRVALQRQLARFVGGAVDPALLQQVAAAARTERWSTGSVLFEEGSPGDAMYVIQRGSVTVAQTRGGREVVLAYVPAGNYVGEMALINAAPRAATVRAASVTETIRIDAASFHALLASSPELRARIEAEATRRTAQNARRQDGTEHGQMIDFLVSRGLGEATDVLLIDESLCVGCDNCERACAATHDGTSRLDREAGPSFANVHVPTSCRHCEHPHCMADCPPDAIHRAPGGEVFIDDTCIGCGNCEANCPYGVIQMAERAPSAPPGGGGMLGLLLGLLRGRDAAQAATTAAPEASHAKRAVKCDMCAGQRAGPACVASCPTGAAIRVDPSRFFELTGRR